MTYRQPKAICRVCGRPYTLNATGLVRKHWARDGMGQALPYSSPCVGSGQTPKEK